MVTVGVYSVVSFPLYTEYNVSFCVNSLLSTIQIHITFQLYAFGGAHKEMLKFVQYWNVIIKRKHYNYIHCAMLMYFI